MNPITHRQREALNFITDYIDTQGYPPTLREIAKHMGIRSTYVVNDHLKALERKGYIVRDELKSRALRPTSKGARSVRVKLLRDPQFGRSSANIAGDIAIDRLIVGDAEEKELFAFTMLDGSMSDDGLYFGDYVVARWTESVDSGDVVVVCVDAKSTVRRALFEGDRVRLRAGLEPRDGALSVSKVELNGVVLGKVVGVVRCYR